MNRPPTPLTEHPVTQLFDATAFGTGAMPPADELDRVAQLISPDNPGRVRARLRETCERIVASCAVGASGHAREIGRAAAVDIANSLPDYHHPDPDAGKPMRQLIDELYPEL